MKTNKNDAISFQQQKARANSTQQALGELCRKLSKELFGFALLRHVIG